MIWRLINLGWRKCFFLFLKWWLLSSLWSSDRRAAWYGILNDRWFECAPLSLSELFLFPCTFYLSLPVLQEYLIPLYNIQLPPSCLISLLWHILYWFNLLLGIQAFLRDSTYVGDYLGLSCLLVVYWGMMLLFRHLKLRSGQLV